MEASTGSSKPAYVSIRPAFRPLLPKPCTHALDSCGDDDKLTKKKKLKTRKHKKPKTNPSIRGPLPSTIAPASLITKRKKSQPQDLTSLLSSSSCPSTVSTRSPGPKSLCDIALRQTTQSSTVMLSCDHEGSQSETSPKSCGSWMSMDIHLPIKSLDPEDPSEPFSPSLSSHSDTVEPCTLEGPHSPGSSISSFNKSSTWPGLIDSEFETPSDIQVSKESETCLDYLFPLDTYLSPTSLTDLYLD